MKAFTGSSSLVKTLSLALLTSTLSTGCRKATSEGSSPAAQSAARLAQDLTGAWVHVGTPGHVQEIPNAGARLKFRTGRHWTLTHADADTGVVMEHFGGTYTLTNNEYIETQEYGDATWSKDNGKSFKFTVRVDGDTMTQYGLDNPYTEVWKRAR
jgi:hypothetical protein